ncbi:MAG: TetR/AcrR family transcriptional regulator [Anaerofustis sp.]
MGKYSAGIATQEKIVNAAKKIFYENGYEKTTIKQICEEAEVLRTVFTYYFSDKSALADHISNYLNLKIMDELIKEATVRNNKTEGLLMDIYASMWFFYNIMSDEHLNRFYAEVLSNNTKLLMGDRYYRTIFQQMYRKSGKNPDSKEFELFFTYSTASPGVFLHHYLIKSSDLTKNEIVEFLNRQVLKSLDIPESEQDTIIEMSFRMIQESDVSFKDLFLSPYRLEPVL